MVFQVIHRPGARAGIKQGSEFVIGITAKAEDGEAVNTAMKLIRHVAQQRNLSLRAIERIMANLAIAFAYTPSNILRVPLQSWVGCVC